MGAGAGAAAVAEARRPEVRPHVVPGATVLLRLLGVGGGGILRGLNFKYLGDQLVRLIDGQSNSFGELKLESRFVAHIGDRVCE